MRWRAVRPITGLLLAFALTAWAHMVLAQVLPPKPPASCRSDEEWAKDVRYQISVGERFIEHERLSSDGATAVFSVSDLHMDRLVAFDTASGHLLWDREEGHANQFEIDSSSREIAAILYKNWECEVAILRRFELRTGIELPLEGLDTKPASQASVNALQYSPDGTLLVAANGGYNEIWDTATGKMRMKDDQSDIGLQPFGEYLNQRIGSLSFSGDNSKLAAAWGITSRLWTVKRGAEWKLVPLGRFATLPRLGQNRIGVARLNADGSKMMVATLDWTRIYDTRTHKILKVFPKTVWIGAFEDADTLRIRADGKFQTYSFKTGKCTDEVKLFNDDLSAFEISGGRVWGFDYNDKWGSSYNDPTTVTLIDQKTGAVLQHFRVPGRMDPAPPPPPK